MFLDGLGSACLDGLAGFWWAWECVLTGLAVVWCRSWRAWECCAVLVLADLGVVLAGFATFAVLCWSWRAEVGLYHAPIFNRFVLI